ncbi:hypothetical protein [Halorussus lipolyticus]|uniref:hypothetical protein n=1 Tax=Halorussus lipolyticus TaxID=3034024 RepID=UPI0023E7BED0|nr:hypothetical protein [Halorussus sp. DT80]
MNDSQRDGEQTSEESTEGRIDRRSVLKGTAVAGLAGAGLAGTASAAGENEITFCAVGSETFSYEVSVTGEVMRGGTYESDSYDEILSESSARGAVSEGRCDSWLFTGDPESLELDGPGKVFVNGELFRDTTSGGDTGGGQLPNRIRIEAKGERVAYKFRVSGRVEKGAQAGTLGVDVIDGNVVRGKVGGSIGGNPDPVDDYRYSGSLAFDSADGPLKVTLDIDG